MRKLIYIALVLLYFTSCDDYIDVKPKGLIVPKTEKDLDMLLKNSGIAYCGELQSMFSDGIFLPSRHVDYLMQSEQDELALAYRLENAFFTAAEEDYTWNSYYKTISTSNYVLEQLQEVSVQNQRLANQLKGEALVHRAFSYFMLVNIYANHFGVGNPSAEESGIPLITKFADTEASLKRATIKEVYDFVLADLKEAVELLDEETDFNYRPNLCSVYVLLSKCYLHMKQYDLAKENIDAAFSTLPSTVSFLNYSEDLEDYDDYYALPWDNLENTEVILNKYFDAPSFFNDASFEFVALTYYSAELVSLFDLNNDLRISKLAVEDEEDGKAVYNYMGFDDGGGAFIGPTLPELYLIRAELYARDNQVSKAMDDLNAIRANRFGEDATSSDINLSAIDATDALQKVVNERRRELAFTGFRMLDVKRYNAYDNANISLIRATDANGTVKTWSAGSINWALPIAQKYIDINPEIKQNDRE
jgi:tetratricopeptide (TPR) repeat protein